ncbi:MAG: hypothetical protein IJ912_02750 [Fibrobacter sp.]|nr:hypothetical protein [Fibrobacter sp.]
MTKIIESIYRLGLATIVSVTPFLFGCSGDSDPSNGYTAEGEYDTNLDDLKKYECSSDREGVIVYLASEDARMVCYKNKWINFSEWQAETGISSSSSKKKGKSSSSTKSYSSSSVKSRSSSSVKFGTAGYDSLIVSRYGDAYLGSVKSLINLPECKNTMDYYAAYVEDMDTYIKCNGHNWVEEHFDRISGNYSTGKEPECDKSVQGAEIQILFDNYVCYDGQWILAKDFEFKNGIADDNSTWNANVLDHDTKHILPDYRDSILGPCTKEKYGTIVHDTTLIDYSKNGYFRCDDKGYWYALTNAEADTVGLKPISEGSFALGRYSTYYPEKTPTFPDQCIVHGDISRSPVYYVYDNKAWRRASFIEICNLNACLKSNEGQEYSMFGYLFRCENSTWVQDSIQNIPKKDFFNPSINYGTLKDPRDGRTYKTVDINGKTWMAENLNYYDTTPNIMGNSNCFLNDEEYCENMGRFYTWTAAMNISPNYITELSPSMTSEAERQGVCPNGWHIPDTLEWNSLETDYTHNDFISQKGWLFTMGSSNIRIVHGDFNSTGFSAVPVNNRYIDRKGVVDLEEQGFMAFFCSSNRYDVDKFFVAAISFSSSTSEITNISNRMDMKTQCSVRCVKNSEE